MNIQWFAFSVLHIFQTALGVSVHPKLLVVSFDGFRYDYFKRNLTPTFQQVGEANTQAKFVINIFPTKTYPNHFSIATGLYTESTGVIDNSVFNDTDQKVMRYGYDLFHYNSSVIPIWTFNELANSTRHSGVMMWAGGEYKYKNILPTFYQSYDVNYNWTKRVDTVMSWFTDETAPINLGMLYFEEPDKVAHEHGPDSTQENNALKKVDWILQYIISSLSALNLTEVNLILLSDHGMEAVTVGRIVNLTSIIGSHRSFGGSPVFQIYPDEGKEDEVYNTLKANGNETGHFKIFKKTEIPDNFYYKNCTRAPPILALASHGYAFEDLLATIIYYNVSYTNQSEFGVHGYDPSDSSMHPFFIASGPAFKKKYSAGELWTVDMFTLFAHVIGLNTTGYHTAGDFNRISSVLESNGSNAMIGCECFRMLVISALLFFLVLHDS